MVGGGMVANGVNYLYHLLMGRALGPESYGVLASAFAVIYIVSVIPVSASFAVVKFISSAKDTKEMYSIFLAVKKLVFRIAAILGVILLIVSPFFAQFLHIDNVLIIAMIAPILFFVISTLVYQSTLQGLLKFWGVTGPIIVSSVGKLVLGLLFVILGMSVVGAMLGIMIAALLAFLYAKMLSGNIPRATKKLEYDLKPLLVYAAPVLVQAVAFTMIFTVDLILVKHYLPPFEAGLYAALSTLGKIIYFAVQPVSSVMFPIVSGKKSRGESYRRVFVFTYSVSVVVSFFIVGMYYLFPELAIGVLYGSDYLAAKDALVWMGLFISVYNLCYFMVNFLLSLGKTKVVVLPAAAFVLQTILVVVFHSSVIEVIKVSLSVVMVLFICINVLVYKYNGGKLRV